MLPEMIISIKSKGLKTHGITLPFLLPAERFGLPSREPALGVLLPSLLFGDLSLLGDFFLPDPPLLAEPTQQDNNKHT